MSIINDALKKAEKTINMEAKIKEDNMEKKSKIRLYLIYILAGCLGVFIASIIFDFLSYQKKTSAAASNPAPAVKKLESPAMPKKAASPIPMQKSPEVLRYTKKETQEPFSLNGIFFSGNEAYALINNKIARPGDAVDGATVKRITVNEVELEVNGSTVKLTTRPK